MYPFIVAGGDGNRIKKIIRKQKALLKFNNKTILDIQIDQLKKINRNIFIAIKNDDKIIINHLNKIRSCKFTFLKETKKLGTAGCLEILNSYKIKDLLVIYSDILFNIDLQKFIRFHKIKKSDLTLFVHPNDHPYDSDLLEINHNKKIKNFFHKPHKKRIIGNLSLAGIYIIKAKLLKNLKKNKYQDFSLDFLPKILKKNYKVYAYKSREYTKDIGTPKRYKTAIKEFNSNKFKKGNLNKKKPAFFFDQNFFKKDKKNTYLKDKNNLNDEAFKLLKKLNKDGFLTIMIMDNNKKDKLNISNTNKQILEFETFLGKKNCYIDEIAFDNLNNKQNKIKILKKITKTFNINLNKSFIIFSRNKKLPLKKINIKSINIEDKIDQNSKFKFKSFETAIKYFLKFNFSDLI